MFRALRGFGGFKLSSVLLVVFGGGEHESHWRVCSSVRLGGAWDAFCSRRGAWAREADHLHVVLKGSTFNCTYMLVS